MKLQLLVVSAFVSQAAFGAQARKTTPPGAGPIPVAFVITEGATMIDFAGPWEVFQDVMVGEEMPFRLYTAPRFRLTAQLGDVSILQRRCASMVLRSSFSCLRSSPVGSAAAKSSVS